MIGASNLPPTAKSGAIERLRYVPEGRGNHWLQIDGRDFATVLQPAERTVKVGDRVTYVECSEAENRTRRVSHGYSPFGAIKFVDILREAT